MNVIAYYSARNNARTIAIARAHGDNNGSLYWDTIDQLRSAFPLMTRMRAREWVDLWIAKDSECPVALAMSRPRTARDLFYTPQSK